MLGDKIRELRTSANLTAAELAERAGLTEVGLYGYEEGASVPTWDSIRRLARALNVGLVWATGYSVDVRAAIKVLESHAPEAAAWWRKNAPHVLERGYRFLFSPEVCERMN
jgi:transcriptional regulator with XRE-family HTH domain